MRFEVRNTGGTLYGTVDVADSRWLLCGTVRFARALNTRMFGPGVLQLDNEHINLSFQTVDFKVRQWATPPAIGQNGGYLSGHLDFCLIWDGPIDALRDVRSFEHAL